MTARGRGLVIAGGIIASCSLAVTVAAIAYFAYGMTASPQAMSMVFPFLLMIWLALSIPAWILGVGLLGAGRHQQRGPVRGSAAAWIVAVGALPAVVVLLVLTVLAASTGGGSLAFVALVVSVPLMIVASIVAGAWLIWGKPAAAPTRVPSTA